MTILTLAQPNIAAAPDPTEQMAECEHPGCGRLHYEDEGALVCYPSGRHLQMCAEHAVADDPGAVVYPGASLAAKWAQDEQARRHDYTLTGA